jgi:hypothetical protein
MKVTNEKLKNYLNTKSKIFGYDVSEVDLKVSKNKILLNGISLDVWHKLLWSWLKESNDRRKEDFFESQTFFDKKTKDLLNLTSNCFACLYCSILADLWCQEYGVWTPACYFCPICGESDLCAKGWYSLWNRNFYPNLKKYAASKIENLKWEWKGIKNENQE